MFQLLIILILFNFTKLCCSQDIQLSIENSTNSEYTGYLWANSKFVFLTPYLKAIAMNGKSVSEKICGFELMSTKLKSVPFMVYLVDELSGLGEIQVKPHIDLEHQKPSTMMLTVEAYDCDPLPHYSNRANIAIHISNEFGPSFSKNVYSFVVKQDSLVGAVVGKVSATGTNNGAIKFSLFHASDLPFELDEKGTIRLLSSLKSINNSLIYFRVVATERSGTIPRQSITTITIEVQPICVNKLTGIPDQLDYKIKSQTNSIVEPERLIQYQHEPRLEVCNLPCPLKEVTLSVDLIHFPASELPNSSNNRICYTDIPTSRIQRRICQAPSGTIDLFLTEGGIINIHSSSKGVGPEVLNDLNEEFTLTWWMKRDNKEQMTIFCIQNNGLEEILSLSIVDCTIAITISGTKKIVTIPDSVCLLNTWLLYSLTRQWPMKTSIKMTVADQALTPVDIKENFLQPSPIRLFAGQCSTSPPEYSKRQNQLQIGVISLSKERYMSTDSIGCLSTCGEALLVSESIKKLSTVNYERRASSLYFKSTSIPAMVNVLSKLEYINSYSWSSGKNNSDRAMTHVAINLSVNCKSGETITVPAAVIKISIVQPPRDTSNDTSEVDIYASSTIFAQGRQSIRLFPDFRFVNSMTEEPIKRDVRIEGCSIRPLQRNFLVQEKIYLSRLMVPIVMESKLKIRYDSSSWNIEGDGTAELYESVVRHVTFDMVNERRKLLIFCTLKSGEFTSQSFVDVILPKKSKISIIKEELPVDIDHYSLNERQRVKEKENQYLKDHFDISKSKFIAIIIMAAVGGGTMAVVTVAVTWFIIRRRSNLMTRNRIKLNDIKCYQRERSPTFQNRPQSSTNCLRGSNDYEFDDEEDRISMADVPEADEQSLDNVSCDTCNMADQDNSCNATIVKDIPRSKTINFPIIHKRF